MSDNKPREFWLKPTKVLERERMGGAWADTIYLSNYHHGHADNWIHVVSASALDDLKAENERCKEIAERDGKDYSDLLKTNAQLTEALRDCVAALEFYADMATNRNHEFIFDDETSSRAAVYEKYAKHSIGDLGCKAYEALAKHRELIEKVRGGK